MSTDGGSPGGRAGTRPGRHGRLRPGAAHHAAGALARPDAADRRPGLRGRPGPATRKYIERRRDPSAPPGYEVADFTEYCVLYREAWTEPSVRWLLSTVPTAMIFDDHDVHDDWNISASWRRDYQAKPWWPERIRSAYMTYWLYQHLGNLPPAELARSELGPDRLGPRRRPAPAGGMRSRSQLTSPGPAAISAGRRPASET